MDTWQINKTHKIILDKLFSDIPTESIKKVLDVGSGRTSLSFLVGRFPTVLVEAVVYPRDLRKINSINKDINRARYKIIETDVADLKFTEVYDVVLAHLFLGEAKKFNNNKFENILSQLLSIRTRFLVIIDIENDPDIDYVMLLEKINPTRVEHVTNEEGINYIGFLVKN